MVNKYILGLTSLQQAIFRMLCIKAGMSLNQRQIAQLLHVSAPAVMKSLPLLEKKSLIALQQDTQTKRWAIELQRNNYKVLQLKRVDNLSLLYESGLVDFLEKEFAGATIILFGSYYRGEDIFSSDIDLAIIGRKEKEMSLAFYEKRLDRKVHLSFYDSFRSIHTHLRENLCNGIIMAGGVAL